MDLGLKGKNAIVLGGTRGIGRAIAATLAGEGSNVAVCARNADQVAATVTELKASGIRATGGPVDVTDGAALKSWIESAAKELGGIDLLFSNAGAMAQGHDAASWNRIFGSMECLVDVIDDLVSSDEPQEKPEVLHQSLTRGIRLQPVPRSI